MNILSKICQLFSNKKEEEVEEVNVISAYSDETVDKLVKLIEAGEITDHITDSSMRLKHPTGAEIYVFVGSNSPYIDVEVDGVGVCYRELTGKQYCILREACEAKLRLALIKKFNKIESVLSKYFKTYTLD